MSFYAINQYQAELEKIIHYGGNKKGPAIRNAFYSLLNEYTRSKDLLLIKEISTKNKQGKLITPDDTLKDNMPTEAWDYKLGNRSALEWILDQYKEKKPGDPTIAKKFNTYRFVDYKEQVIDLLKRVCRVSVETVRIVREIEVVQTKSSL